MGPNHVWGQLTPLLECLTPTNSTTSSSLGISCTTYVKANNEQDRETDIFPFICFFSRTTWVSRHQKDKTIPDL